MEFKIRASFELIEVFKFHKKIAVIRNHACLIYESLQSWQLSQDCETNGRHAVLYPTQYLWR